jgi:transposase
LIIGAVCARRDTGVALVMTALDTEAMSLFLAELSHAVAPGAHAIVLMDKAGWHIAGDLVVPANLSLVFLPPYSPELNPIERLWLYIRDTHLTHRVFADTAQIIDACCDAWNALLAETGRIRSLCSYPWLEKVSP